VALLWRCFGLDWIETPNSFGLFRMESLFFVAIFFFFFSFLISSLDPHNSRANTFVGASTGGDPGEINVPVIGGHAGITILPLFSQVPGYSPDDEELAAITKRTQFGGDEVVQAKAGAGSATLSMAYAGYLFADKVLQAMNGADDIVQCAFVESDITDAQFFSSPCKFGPDGVEEVMGYGEISDYEQGWFDKMMPDLKAQIEKGIEFANK
jgi:malate dehydrogenase